MNDFDSEEKSSKISNRSVIGSVIGLSIGIAVLVIIFVNPILIIGYIWDYDIEQQLLSANSQGLILDPDLTLTLNGEEQNIKQVKMRFSYENTYNNPEEVKIRVDRAIMVFENLFSDPDKQWTKEVIDDRTTIQFVWKPEVMK